MSSSRITYICFFLLMISMIYSSLNLTTATMFLVSIVMFFTCAANSTHLLGKKPTLIFITLALIIGWFAEFTGERYGWFFGDYNYTEALGLKLLGVPVVIPIMWFNLCYIAMILSFLILERTPFKKPTGFLDIFSVSLLSAVLVTAYDLAADPYMIHVVKAWIMEKEGGWWFGGTLVGFLGWMSVTLLIMLSFFLSIRRRNWSLPKDFKTTHALIPVCLYFSWMVFQMTYGFPYETRTISAFAMGTPLLIITLTYKHWKNFGLPARGQQ